MSKRYGSTNALRVPIGRRVEEADPIARAEVLASEFGVAGDGPSEADHRARPAQHLFCCGRQQRRIMAELLELIGVRDERHQPLRQRIAGRFAAGDREDQEEQVEFEVVELSGREDRPHVVGRVGPLHLVELAGAVVDVQLDLQPLVGRNFVRWIHRAQQRVSEAEHLGAVVLRNADDVGDHVHRDQVRDVGDEVEIAERGRLVEDPIGAGPDLLLELGDHPWREPGADQSPHPGMFGSFLGDEHHPASFLLERDDHGAVEGGEGLPVTVGLLHLPMAEHRPEADVGVERRDVRLRVPTDRPARAHLVVEVVRHAVAIQRRVEQIGVADLVPGHSSQHCSRPAGSLLSWSALPRPRDAWGCGRPHRRDAPNGR